MINGFGTSYGWWPTDTELLSNNRRVLRCGIKRDAVRVPYDIGITTHAILRWHGAAIGDVLAHRRQHLYFLVPAETAPVWEELRQATACTAVPLRLISHGGIVLLPAHRRERMVRWIHGPGNGPSPSTVNVLTAISHANNRLLIRGQQRVQDQQNTALIQQAWHAMTGQQSRSGDPTREARPATPHVGEDRAAISATWLNYYNR